MNRQETFKIEEIKERARFIERCNDFFSRNQKVLMVCSDCLIYVFDSMCEAIMFIIYRVKELDFVGTFIEGEIFNIGSPDIGIRVSTNVESYIVKTLDSYKYEQESEKIRKEQEEIDFMLSGNHERFMDDLRAKAALIKLELSNFNFDKNSKNSIIHILNRYFGDDGWIRYWFTDCQLDKIYVDITLNILLSDSAVINIPFDKPVKNKTLKIMKGADNHEKTI